MTPVTPLQGQERIAGALAYIFFIIPMLMGTKTDFTMFHAKQSLMLLFCVILASFVPFLGWLISLCIVLISLWSLYQAYLGNKFVIPVLGENMDNLYSKIGLLPFFSVK